MHLTLPKAKRRIKTCQEEATHAAERAASPAVKLGASLKIHCSPYNGHGQLCDEDLKKCFASPTSLYFYHFEHCLKNSTTPIMYY